MLVVFRYTSDQKGIRETKDKIKAHLIEIRLFKDNLGIQFSAQKNILLYNFKYMRYALKPMLFMIVPVAIILIQMNAWYGYRPLAPGESIVVSIKVLDKAPEILSSISIEAEKGLVVETPPLRISQAKEVNWRIRADELGEHNLIFNVAGHIFQKSVIVSDGRLTRVSPNMVNSSLFWDVLLNPGEKPIAENSLVKRIEINYPIRLFRIFGWNMHWLVVFIVLSIFSGFVLKKLFRVEI